MACHFKLQFHIAMFTYDNNLVFITPSDLQKLLVIAQLHKRNEVSNDYNLHSTFGDSKWD